MKRKAKCGTVRTQRELAKALGISTTTLHYHIKKQGSPKLNDVAGWVVYLAEHGRTGSAPPDLRRAIAEKRLAILTEQHADLVRENRRKDGETISRGSVIQGAQTIMALIFMELDRIFCLEFPPLAKGLDEVSIRQKSEASITKLKGSLRLKFDSMAAEPK